VGTFAALFALLPDWLDPEKLIVRGSYLIIFGIVFAESGLLVGFFLPGDSLLFTAGMFAAGTFAEEFPDFNLSIWILLPGIFLAAVIGDQMGYAFGNKAGAALFRRPDSRLFKHEHLEKAQGFFDRHGPRAIVLARFVPVVRTFAPIVAGAGKMEYRTFLRYNLLGGLLWGVGVTLLGYFLGTIPFIADNVELALILVVMVSVLPIAFEFLRSRRRRTPTEV